MKCRELLTTRCNDNTAFCDQVIEPNLSAAECL